MSKLKHYTNKLAHILIGYLSGLFSFIDFKISVFLYILFFMYEFIEEEKIHDEMYHELKEFTIGYVIGVLMAYYNSLLLLINP